MGNSTSCGETTTIDRNDICQAKLPPIMALPSEILPTMCQQNHFSETECNEKSSEVNDAYRNCAFKSKNTHEFETCFKKWGSEKTWMKE